MFATSQEVRDHTSFEEIRELTDPQMEAYLVRAERWIYRATGMDYMSESDEGKLQDLKTASIHLVELLWYQDLEESKEQVLSMTHSEKVGSYSYTLMKEAAPEGETGIPELDNILENLKPGPYGMNFFSVTGPSR